MKNNQMWLLYFLILAQASSVFSSIVPVAEAGSAAATRHFVEAREAAEAAANSLGFGSSRSSNALEGVPTSSGDLAEAHARLSNLTSEQISSFASEVAAQGDADAIAESLENAVSGSSSDSGSNEIDPKLVEIIEENKEVQEIRGLVLDDSAYINAINNILEAKGLQAFALPVSASQKSQGTLASAADCTKYWEWIIIYQGGVFLGAVHRSLSKMIITPAGRAWLQKNKHFGKAFQPVSPQPVYNHAGQEILSGMPLLPVSPLADLAQLEPKAFWALQYMIDNQIVLSQTDPLPDAFKVFEALNAQAEQLNLFARTMKKEEAIVQKSIGYTMRRLMNNEISIGEVVESVIKEFDRLGVSKITKRWNNPSWATTFADTADLFKVYVQGAFAAIAYDAVVYGSMMRMAGDGVYAKYAKHIQNDNRALFTFMFFMGVGAGFMESQREDNVMHRIKAAFVAMSNQGKDKIALTKENMKKFCELAWYTLVTQDAQRAAEGDGSKLQKDIDQYSDKLKVALESIINGNEQVNISSVSKSSEIAMKIADAITSAQAYGLNYDLDNKGFMESLKSLDVNQSAFKKAMQDSVAQEIVKNALYSKAKNASLKDKTYWAVGKVKRGLGRFISTDERPASSEDIDSIIDSDVDLTNLPKDAADKLEQKLEQIIQNDPSFKNLQAEMLAGLDGSFRDKVRAFVQRLKANNELSSVVSNPQRLNTIINRDSVIFGDADLNAEQKEYIKGYVAGLA